MQEESPSSLWKPLGKAAGLATLFIASTTLLVGATVTTLALLGVSTKVGMGMLLALSGLGAAGVVVLALGAVALGVAGVYYTSKWAKPGEAHDEAVTAESDNTEKATAKSEAESDMDETASASSSQNVTVLKSLGGAGKKAVSKVKSSAKTAKGWILSHIGRGKPADTTAAAPGRDSEIPSIDFKGKL